MSSKAFRLLLCLLALAALGIFGCSDDDDNPTANGPVITDEQLDSAFIQLFNMTEMMVDSAVDGSNFRPEDFDYTGLHAIFTGYLDAHPGNAKASFGAGITSMMTLTSNSALIELVDSIMDTEDWGNASGRNIRLPQKISDRRDIVRLPRDVRDAGIETGSLAQTYLAVVARAAESPIQFSDIQQAIRQYVLPSLNSGIGYFNNVLNDSDFVFWVTPDMISDSTFDSMEIDRADFLTITAGLNVVKSLLYIVVAYDVDLPSYDIEGIEYMLDQSNSWMSLYSGGTSYMSGSRTTFLGAVELAKEALLALENEAISDPDQTDELIPADLDSTDIDEYMAILDSIGVYLTEPKWVYGEFDDESGEDSIRVDLQQIFDNPIEGIFTYLPPYTAEVEELIDTFWEHTSPTDSVIDEIDTVIHVTLTWDANTFEQWEFPDPTFNGILPDMTDTDELCETLGFEAEDWEKVEYFYIDFGEILGFLPF